MKLMKLYEEMKTRGDEIYYHGTDRDHDFSSHGYLADGTFLSKDAKVAKSYGNIIYEIILAPNLKIFNVIDRIDVEKLLNSVGELYDTYYDEDEDEYLISTADDLMNSSDPWNPIEKTPGVLDYLRREYDGVRIFEGGSEDNLLLFSPVRDKIKSIRRL